MKKQILSAVALASMLLVGTAHAGPFILAGTDADDHGSATATTNIDGWFFMQRALENLAPGVTTPNKVVTVLGSTSTALSAASSAFNKSTLVGAGWSLQVITTANFGAFFGGPANLGSGILMMDSGNNVTGGVDGASFVPYAGVINTFLGAGGSLFSQANGYDWVSTLIAGIAAPGEFDTGVALTANGSAAFPGLTNGDLSSGPYHNSFTGFGGLTVLGTSTATNNAIIIGSAGGSITQPSAPVPEPGSLALVGLALAALGFMRKRK